MKKFNSQKFDCEDVATSNWQNKILFLVDHKHRDLPALSLIAYYMDAMGCVTRLLALGCKDSDIDEFDPGFIVLPKPAYDLQKWIRWKLDRRKIIVIDSEGNPQDIAYQIKIRIAPELYCFWNKTIRNRYENQIGDRGTEMKVLGFYRSDFLHKKYIDIFPDRKKLLKSYGMDPKNKTVTIATSTQDSHFSDERLNRKYKKRNRNLKETADYLDIVNNMRKLRETTEDLINVIAECFPNVNIAIKPHPNESAVYWNDFISGLNRSNIALVVGEPINHLFKVSDLHIAHNVCTTTIESMMFGLPNVEIHTAYSRKLYQDEHLRMANFLITNSRDIVPIIKSVFYQEKDDVSPELVNDSNLDWYVEKYFYKFDGDRCFEYAKYISEYMNKERKSSIDFFSFLLDYPNLIFPYLYVSVRGLLRKMVGVGVYNKIEREINAPTEENTREICDIQGVLVDKEYGLYDNRMKKGDEGEWFDKFNQSVYVRELLKKEGLLG